MTIQKGSKEKKNAWHSCCHIWVRVQLRNTTQIRSILKSSHSRYHTTEVAGTEFILTSYRHFKQNDGLNLDFIARKTSLLYYGVNIPMVFRYIFFQEFHCLKRNKISHSNDNTNYKSVLYCTNLHIGTGLSTGYGKDVKLRKSIHTFCTGDCT